MILDLIHNSNEILYKKLEDFDFANPPEDPVQFARDLAETMMHHMGLGLAANQVGRSLRCFVMRSNPIICCYNPIIVDASDEKVTLEEGCLSFKNLFVKVKRPRIIKVRYTEPNGNVETKTFTDMTARIFQHELDHLDGIVFTKRANSIHLIQARNKQNRLNRRK